MRSLLVTSAVALALMAPAALAQQDEPADTGSQPASEDSATGVSDALPDGPTADEDTDPSMYPDEPADDRADATMDNGSDGDRADDADGPDQQAASGYEPFLDMTVGDVVGRIVEGPDGQRVGDVDYVIRDGTDISAIVGVGGFLSLGEHTVAIPLSSLRIVGEDRLALPNMTEEELRDMEEISEADLASLADDEAIGDLL